MLKSFALLLSALLISSCTLYESEGRKIFNSEGDELTSLSKLTPLTSREFDEVTAKGFGTCEAVETKTALAMIHPDMTYWETEEEDYLFSLDSGQSAEFVVIAPKLTSRPITLCFPEPETK